MSYFCVLHQIIQMMIFLSIQTYALAEPCILAFPRFWPILLNEQENKYVRIVCIFHYSILRGVDYGQKLLMGKLFFTV